MTQETSVQIPTAEIIDQVREQLAEYAHDAWSRWVKFKYVDGTFCRGDEANRLLRLASTKYQDLTEAQKDLDRREADKILAIIKDAQTCPCQP